VHKIVFRMVITTEAPGVCLGIGLNGSPSPHLEMSGSLLKTFPLSN
jgi:hypothetical protein